MQRPMAYTLMNHSASHEITQREALMAAIDRVYLVKADKNCLVLTLDS